MVPLDELQDYSPNGRRRRYAMWAAIAAAVGLALFFLLQPAEGPDGSAGPQRLASFERPLLDGSGTLSSADLEGHPVVLNFFASWCHPCREEAPIFEKTYKEYKDRGVRFIGIATQDTEDPAKAFVKEFGITYPVVEDFGHEIFDELGLIGLPTTLFITPDLTIVEREAGGEVESGGGRPPTLGAITEAELEAGIEDLLETR
ncbi:MAG: TlpA family protein disulfide reductase [Actinomycetota bacterium]|nr:TlpA family protein disulfide reductase [Actinomycetota bacterium]